MKVSDFDLRNACREGNVELVQKCLASGVRNTATWTKIQVNPNATAYGIASLHFAAKEGHTEILQLLIDAGANVNHLGKITEHCSLERWYILVSVRPCHRIPKI